MRGVLTRNAVNNGKIRHLVPEYLLQLTICTDTGKKQRARTITFLLIEVTHIFLLQHANGLSAQSSSAEEQFAREESS